MLDLHVEINRVDIFYEIIAKKLSKANSEVKKIFFKYYHGQRTLLFRNPYVKFSSTVVLHDTLCGQDYRKSRTHLYKYEVMCRCPSQRV